MLLLEHVDDSLISGTPKELKHLQQQLQRHFKYKFITKPKDFLELDLTHKEPGEVTLSMETFSTKMEQVLKLQDTFSGDAFTPGRTDKKIIRGVNLEENKEHRNRVGTLNWLCMGVRYDVVYTTKELSRALSEPTTTASARVPDLSDEKETYRHGRQLRHVTIEYTRWHSIRR
jgi:hypothetical protein